MKADGNLCHARGPVRNPVSSDRPDRQRRGYVYLAQNDAMPGLWKIGRAADPEARMRQLSAATGVPRPFWVRTYTLCDDCQVGERLVHALLAPHRVRSQREFFDCHLDVACQAMQDVSDFFEKEAMLKAGFVKTPTGWQPKESSE